MTYSPTVSDLNVELQQGKPPLLRAEAAAGKATQWAAEQRDALRAFIAEHGVLMIRGLGLRDAADTEAVFRQLGNLMVEAEAFAPRRCYTQGVYSASRWPPNQQMCMHHELSYALEIPSMMLFACIEAPASGGATPVADASAVLEDLPADLVEAFEREGWLLIRNYNEDIGASLVEAFGTEDKGAIESYCRAHGIEFDWQKDGGLRTRQRRSAVVRHPLSGRRCWFNQIAFLSEWTLAAEVREYLVDVYGADGLPFNTRFGNGNPIGADIVQIINDVYDRHTTQDAWQAGDLLLVDNVRTAHGREPFEGAREIVVALADAVRLSG
jgi:alpha-ketoglutarate-dependent taurine dioxygenase